MVFIIYLQFSSVQSLSCVRSATPWIAACQASLSITNSWGSLRLTSIKSVMPSSHLILCHPLLLLPPTTKAGRRCMRTQGRSFLFTGLLLLHQCCWVTWSCPAWQWATLSLGNPSLLKRTKSAQLCSKWRYPKEQKAYPLLRRNMQDQWKLVFQKCS